MLQVCSSESESDDVNVVGSFLGILKYNSWHKGPGVLAKLDLSKKVIDNLSPLKVFFSSYLKDFPSPNLLLLSFLFFLLDSLFFLHFLFSENSFLYFSFFPSGLFFFLFLLLFNLLLLSLLFLFALYKHVCALWCRSSAQLAYSFPIRVLVSAGGAWIAYDSQVSRLWVFL